MPAQSPLMEQVERDSQLVLSVFGAEDGGLGIHEYFIFSRTVMARDEATHPETVEQLADVIHKFAQLLRTVTNTEKVLGR